MTLLFRILTKNLFLISSNRRTMILSHLIILFSSIWIRQDFAVIWVSPLNAIGVVGKSVTFECSASDLKDHIQWLYKSFGGRVVTIWEKPGVKNKVFFEKIDVNQKNHHGGHFGFDLKINDLRLEDEGTYTCVVTSGTTRNKHDASLSVIEIDICLATITQNILNHECRFILAGPARYKFRWECQHYSVSEFSNKTDEIINSFGDMVPVEAVRAITRMSISSKHPVTLATCYMEIISINPVGAEVPFKDIGLPYFNGKVFLASVMPGGLDTTLLENCKIEHGGHLKLAVKIAFDEVYSKRHKLIEPEVATFRYICRLPETTTVQPVTLAYVEGNQMVNCEDNKGMECLKGYSRRVVMGTSVPQLSSRVMRRLCSSIEEVEGCVKGIEPCTMTKRMKGMLESYRFMCNTLYDLAEDTLLFDVDMEKCFDHYPQAIGNLLINGSLNTRLNNERLRKTGPVNYAFCQHLAGISEMHCTEHLLASYRSLSASRWYASFIRILNQVDYFRLMSFSEIPLTDKDCWKSIDQLDALQCNFAEECAQVYAGLLRTIHFGMIFIDNFTAFEKTVCNDVILTHCQSYLAENCDIPTSSLFRSLTKLKKALCWTFKRKLQEGQHCFMQIYASSVLPDKCTWSHEFMNHYSKQAGGSDSMKDGCKLAVDHMECVQGVITRECGIMAGNLQKDLLQVIFAGSVLRARCMFLAPVAAKRKFAIRRPKFRMSSSESISLDYPMVVFVAFILNYRRGHQY